MTDECQQTERTTPSIKPALGIRRRLMVLALIAIVPLVLDRARTIETDRSERVEAAYRQALNWRNAALASNPT